MTNTAGAEMEATGIANANTDVAPPDLMTVEPVCVMILRTAFPAAGKAGAVHTTRVALEAMTAADMSVVPMEDISNWQR